MKPPFQVRTAGLVRDQPYHSTPGTRQGDIMLTVFLAGQGLYRTSNVRQDIKPGMVGLVPPEEPGILMAAAGNPYTHYYCRFNGPYAGYLARRIIAAHGARFFEVANAEEIADRVRQMGPIFRTELPDQMGGPELLLARILVTLLCPESRPAATISAPALEEYLRNHLAEPHDLGKMADYFQISRAGLCRVARRLCGRTVVQMSEKMKIDWAKILLDSTTLKVHEVGLRVGYPDPFHFSRVFKKHTGLSPKFWIRQAGKESKLPE
jgi:AraC family transcriptional regulator, arabinose operon regulatory protein